MKFFPWILKEVNYLRGLDTDGKIMLKWIIKYTGCEVVNWFQTGLG